MLLSVGGNTIDVDIEATKNLYKYIYYIWQDCSCPICRHFVEKVESCSPQTLRFLTEFGINPYKSVGVWPYEPGEEVHSQRFMAIYPINCVPVVLKENLDDCVFEQIDTGLYIAIAKYENGLAIKVDWELPWMGI